MRQVYAIRCPIVGRSGRVPSRDHRSGRANTRPWLVSQRGGPFQCRKSGPGSRVSAALACYVLIAPSRPRRPEATPRRSTAETGRRPPGEFGSKVTFGWETHRSVQPSKALSVRDSSAQHGGRRKLSFSRRRWPRSPPSSRGRPGGSRRPACWSVARRPRRSAWPAHSRPPSWRRHQW
jgi:hypothetical protein